MDELDLGYAWGKYWVKHCPDFYEDWVGNQLASKMSCPETLKK